MSNDFRLEFIKCCYFSDRPTRGIQTLCILLDAVFSPSGVCLPPISIPGLWLHPSVHVTAVPPSARALLTDPVEGQHPGDEDPRLHYGPL